MAMADHTIPLFHCGHDDDGDDYEGDDDDGLYDYENGASTPREMSLLRHMLLNLIVDLLDCITEILQSLEQKYKNSKLLVNRAGHKQEQEK